jgi:glucose uptake protein
LLVLVFSMLCLGSWANTQKASGGWRFELFYYDFSLGVVLCALVAAFTLGSMNSQELSFQDNLLITGKRQMAYAFGAGIVFNLGNLLLLGAMQVAGMGVAFSITFGLALAIGAISSYFLNPQSNATLLFSGAVLVLIAVALGTLAHGSYADEKDSLNKPLRPDPRARTPRPPSAVLGIILSLLSAIFMSLSYPLAESAMTEETALSPYGVALLFSGGILLSTLLYIPFFVSFPVRGGAVEMRAYFKGTKKEHFWGILGGIIWMAGTLARYTAAAAPAAAQTGPIVSYVLWQVAPLIAALWGLLVWREFRGATLRVKTLVAGMLILYAAGIAVVSVAPLYTK